MERDWTRGSRANTDNHCSIKRLLLLFSLEKLHILHARLDAKVSLLIDDYIYSVLGLVFVGGCCSVDDIDKWFDRMYSVRSRRTPRIETYLLSESRLLDLLGQLRNRFT